MALGVSDVREIVERVCARPDVLDACRHRDLGVVVEVLGGHGVTQGQIAGLTGSSQGRLSEYMKHKRTPRHSSIRSRAEQGLPERIEDPATAAKLAAMLSDQPAHPTQQEPTLPRYSRERQARPCLSCRSRLSESRRAPGQSPEGSCAGKTGGVRRSLSLAGSRNCSGSRNSMRSTRVFCT
jgi:predicted transcriptional regulator